MRLVVQRVERASVRVEGKPEVRIGQGLLVLVGVARGDDLSLAAEMARRVVGLRLFPDATGRTGASLQDVAGELLCVSQFTLMAELKGRRPGFGPAEEPRLAEQIWDGFCCTVEACGIPCRRGTFGADMKVELVNDGPFTLVLDSASP